MKTADFVYLMSVIITFVGFIQSCKTREVAKPLSHSTELKLPTFFLDESKCPFTLSSSQVLGQSEDNTARCGYLVVSYVENSVETLEFRMPFVQFRSSKRTGVLKCFEPPMTSQGCWREAYDWHEQLSRSPSQKLRYLSTIWNAPEWNGLRPQQRRTHFSGFRPLKFFC